MNETANNNKPIERKCYSKEENKMKNTSEETSKVFSKKKLTHTTLIFYH